MAISIHKMAQSLKEILQMLVTDRDWKPNLLQPQLHEIWSRLMGTTITKYTRSLQMHQHILYITLDSPTLKTELSFSKDKIKDMLNTELGEKYILEVVIK